MTAITHSQREQWLMRRKTLLGASDCAAVLGVDPRRGPLAVYLSKVSDGIDEHDNNWMRFGRDIEGAVGNWYHHETGRFVQDLGGAEIQIHPDLPWLGATLDRWTSMTSIPPKDSPHPGGPLEIKSVGFQNKGKWKEEEPAQYQVQLQIQMACTGAQWGSLAALMGGVALQWGDIDRDDALLNKALPELEEFWMRVQKRDPPPADGLPGTSSLIRDLWPEDDGETIILPDETLERAQELDDIKDKIKELGISKAEIENNLRLLMGSAERGVLMDGSSLTLKRVERKGYEVKPSSYRPLLRKHPRLTKGTQ